MARRRTWSKDGVCRIDLLNDVGFTAASADWLGDTRLDSLAVRAVNKCFSVLVAGAFHSFGRRSVLQLPVRLGGARRIAIGEGVFVGSNSWLQTVGDNEGDPALFLGDGTSISGMAHLSAACSIRLGRNVLLARNVFVTDHGHRFDDLGLAVLSQGITNPRPVVIGDGAWLGENVVVLPGVTVGAGAVIGANSVVVDDVPEHSVAVGAPARVLRSLVNRERSEDEPTQDERLAGAGGS